MQKRHVIYLATFALSAITLGVLVGLAANGPAKAAPSSTSGPASPAAQVQWLCAQASSTVANGSATPFLQYADQQCQQVGQSQLSAASQVPLGTMLCKFVQNEVSSGNTSDGYPTAVQLCNMKSPAPDMGITQTNEPPPASSNIVITGNRWSGVVNNAYTAVFAGSQPAQLFDGSSGNTKLGVVVVWVPSNNQLINISSSGQDGALTINSASGDVLSLSAADGASYTFDAASNTLQKAS